MVERKSNTRSGSVSCSLQGVAILVWNTAPSGENGLTAEDRSLTHVKNAVGLAAEVEGLPCHEGQRVLPAARQRAGYVAIVRRPIAILVGAGTAAELGPRGVREKRRPALTGKAGDKAKEFI